MKVGKLSYRERRAFKAGFATMFAAALIMCGGVAFLAHRAGVNACEAGEAGAHA